MLQKWLNVHKGSLRSFFLLKTCSKPALEWNDFFDFLNPKTEKKVKQFIFLCSFARFWGCGETLHSFGIELLKICPIISYVPFIEIRKITKSLHPTAGDNYPFLPLKLEGEE